IPLAFFACWNILSSIARNRDRSRSPIMERLQRYGTVHGPVDRLIGAEFRCSAEPLLRNTWITDRWLLRQSIFDFHAIRLQEILWVYEKVVTTYYGFLPVVKRRELIVYDRDGRRIACWARKAGIARAMPRLAVRAPWAVYGYSNELKDLMSNDR